jgi:uncharacterized protein (DUF849 family)
MKVCLNRGRGREDHPAVPLTPAELAASAAAAVAAGAEAAHLHPRRADGGEWWWWGPARRPVPTARAATGTARTLTCPGRALPLSA